MASTPEENEADREVRCTHGHYIEPRPVTVLQLEEARMVSLEDLRADIIRSAAQGQWPTFIAAKLDILIAKATFAGVLPERCSCEIDRHDFDCPLHKDMPR